MDIKDELKVYKNKSLREFRQRKWDALQKKRQGKQKAISLLISSSIIPLAAQAMV